MDYEKWFLEGLAEFRDDPEFVADGISMDILSGLKQAMERQKVTKKELARRVGVSPAFISQVFNGKPNLTLLTLAKLAIALDLEYQVCLSPRDAQPQAEAKVEKKPRHTPRRKPLQPATPRRSRRAAAPTG